MKHILASFGMWLARRVGSVRPGDIPSCTASAPKFITVTEFEDYPHKRVIGGPYPTKESAEMAANVGRALLDGYSPVPFEIRVEPLLVGREDPHEATAPTEAKP
jgi:hypothetical protein